MVIQRRMVTCKTFVALFHLFTQSYDLGLLFLKLGRVVLQLGVVSSEPGVVFLEFGTVVFKLRCCSALREYNGRGEMLNAFVLPMSRLGWTLFI
jgi:hypothetical protein